VLLLLDGFHHAYRVMALVLNVRTGGADGCVAVSAKETETLSLVGGAVEVAFPLEVRAFGGGGEGGDAKVVL
jgi:hypothetical protein